MNNIYQDYFDISIADNIKKFEKKIETTDINLKEIIKNNS